MADKIQKTDTLNQGRIKLNEAIDEAGTAKWESGRALDKAEQALAKSTNTQTQLDTIVVEGDSSVEAAQARIGADNSVHSTLKARLDSEYNELESKTVGKVDTSDYIVRNAQVDQSLSEQSAEIISINNRLAGVKFTEITEPVYIAHRGAKNIFPEASMEAYRGCVSMGVNIIEMDVRVTTDGALICHHDDMMERTTNKTGQVKNYSSMGFKSAVIDELPGWNGTPTLFEDLLREFGNKVIYVPEVKDFQDSTSKLITDSIIEHNLQDNVIIQSFSAPNLTYPISKGIPVMYLKAQNDTPPSTIKGWGINYVGLSKTVPNSYVSDCIHAGLNVYMYTVNRRFEHDHYLGLGVSGFFTDDPLWISRKSPVLEWDPYRDQVFTHGQISPPSIPEFVGGNRGVFEAPNKFGWLTENSVSDFSLQGWVGELPESFTFNVKINFVKSVSSLRWASVALCTPNDFWDDFSDSLCGGYHILIRENGTIDIFKRVIGQPATQIQTLNTSPISQGQSIQMKIQVASSTITVTRTDTNNSVSISDSTYRGGYLHFGRRYLGASFENVQIISQ